MKTRPIKFEDLKNGDIVQYHHGNDDWNHSLWQVIDKSLYLEGQVVNLLSNYKSYFSPTTGLTFRILQSDGKWKDKIADIKTNVTVTFTIDKANLPPCVEEFKELQARLGLTNFKMV